MYDAFNRKEGDISQYLASRAGGKAIKREVMGAPTLISIVSTRIQCVAFIVDQHSPTEAGHGLADQGRGEVQSE